MLPSVDFVLWVATVAIGFISCVGLVITISDWKTLKWSRAIYDLFFSVGGISYAIFMGHVLYLY